MLAHMQDHVSSLLSCFNIPVRLDGLFQRVDSIYNRPQLSGLNELPEVDQVLSLEIERHKDNLILIVIEANAFLREMVRSIVGTLVDVGRGKTSVSEFKKIFGAHDRRCAGMTAPAHGLFLVEVKY